MQKPLICLMFDRSGGALARFGLDYWHGYDDMPMMAVDFCHYVLTGETHSLPRNEKADYEWPEPSQFAVDRGLAARYSNAEIMEAAQKDTPVRFGDLGLFLDALRQFLD